MALTVLQDLRMQSISHHTKPPNMPWEATKAAARSTIPSQRVRRINDLTIRICR